MTTEHQASRTLVKSPPELWAECSDPGSLGRHIGEFGEIRITRLDPETSIAWEADRAVGTVEIEPSGWGTRVTLTAQTRADEDGQEEVDAGIPVEGPAPIDLAGATEAAPDPPPAQVDPVEEESDAKMEETVAQSDPAVAASDSVRAGGRWRRLIARTRTWFGSAEEPLLAPPTGTAAAPSRSILVVSSQDNGSQPAGSSGDAPEEEVGEPENVAPETETAVLEFSPPDEVAPAGATDGPEADPPDEPGRAPRLTWRDRLTPRRC